MAFYSIFFVLAVGHLVTADFVGKFVFHGSNNNNNEDQQASLSVYHKPDSVHFAPSPGPLPANEISSVLSLSLGLSIPKDISWNGLLAGSLFQRPKAVLMVSVENLPKGQSLKRKVSQTLPVALTNDASSISDVYTMSSTLSLPAHVNEIMNGKSTTVSVSADENTAAMGFSGGEHSTTSFWSDMSDSWKIVSGDGRKKDGLTKHGIYKRIAAVLPKGYTHNVEEKKVVVNTADLQVSFDLKNHIDFALFSELTFMRWQYDEIAANKKLAKDGAPDVYLFSVSALKGIEKMYGGDSKQMQAAVRLLEAVIPEIVADFKSLYKGNILAVGLNIQSQASEVEAHKGDLHKILSSLKDQFGHEFEHTAPELHATKHMEKSARKELCSAIQGAISRFAPSIKFKCHTEGDDSIHKVFRRSLMAVDINSDKLLQDYNIASAYDGMFPVIFNIWFWLLVVLALATYAISVAMWNMDPGRDSIIYRLTQQKIKGD